MKIHSGDCLPPGVQQAAPKPKASPAESFVDVLQQAYMAPHAERSTAAVPAAPIVRPLPAGVPYGDGLFQSAERTLNALDRYQQLLGHAGVSLRTLEPAVREIQNQVGRLEPITEGLPEDHPLRQIACQTIVAAAREIARYSRGDYVDD